ncbi:hypothetical protein CCACVL1_09043 [Corchorus capsularis]|uniref:Uncharacterized protein n=1 Tax=Corchorus capsularis TaxID=210143 RepID=A0A1R3IXV6_COCAP|nr:hypothetical protein CCACVL1_09043 [Corchorus capsularis]
MAKCPSTHMKAGHSPLQYVPKLSYYQADTH